MRSVMSAALLSGCIAAEPLPTDPTSTVAPAHALAFSEGQVPKNILMISLDTFRRDHFDLYGDRGLMPFFSGLAQQGFHVEDYRSCSTYTFHATTCVAGGRYALEGAEDYGVMPQLGLEGEVLDPIPDNTPLMPGYMGGLGFHTMFVTANTMYGERLGNGAGYDLYFEHSSDNASDNLFLAAKIIAEQREQGSMQEDQPWFMHVHLLDPHIPYNPPDEHLERLIGLPDTGFDLSMRSGHLAATTAALSGSIPADEAENVYEQLRIRYEAEIHWLDQKLEEAWEHLDSEGLLDNTLVVVWTDHGEQLGEHGRWGHAQMPHAEENDGLLFFWAKNLERGNHTSPVSSTDLLPTLLSLYGGDIPNSITGLPIGTAPPDRVIFATSLAKSGPLVAASQGSRKLIFAWDNDMAVLPEMAQNQPYGLQFYDRATDPTEVNDLFS
ncbi:MAG: sulfatase-like hydrolase/transferase, partial [Rhodobacterales bacterium]|nr:sulfatase-like hydrolase/transferase [Rhodobacterales bacterium]